MGVVVHCNHVSFEQYGKMAPMRPDYGDTVPIGQDSNQEFFHCSSSKGSTSSSAQSILTP